MQNFGKIAKSQQKAMQMLKSPDEIKQTLYVKEGDNALHTQLYPQAIDAYSKALEISENSAVLLQRSRCYIATGQINNAIEDAEHAMKLDQQNGNIDQFYRGYFQKAEAYYAAGEFEEALLFYYKAFWSRPNIYDYKLGVQKAEQSVIRALDACISPPDQFCQFYPDPCPTQESIVETMNDPSYPQESVAEFRCLCGCTYCRCGQCRDLYQEPGQHCSCRCEACIHHLAYSHGMVADPVSGALVSVNICKQDVSINSTSTPVQEHTQQKNKQSLQDTLRDQRRKNCKHSTALEKDRQLIQELLQDASLNKTVKNLDQTLNKSLKFMNNRDQFWRQQGTQKVSVNVKKYVNLPWKSVNANFSKLLNTATQQTTTESEVQKTTTISNPLQSIIDKMTEASQCMINQNFDLAFQIGTELNQNINENIPARLQGDIKTLLGCALFEQHDYLQAANLFKETTKISEQVDDEYGVLRGNRNTARTLMECQQYAEAAQYFQTSLQSTMQVPPILRASDLYNCALCLAELNFKENKAQIQNLINRCAQAICQAPLSSSSKVVIANTFFEFHDQAPSFFTVQCNSPNEIFFDLLLLQAKVYGTQEHQKTQVILNLLLERATMAEDLEACKATLQSFLFLFKALGDFQGVEWAESKLKEIQ
ncbi:Dynein_binding protein [Hexamita inflata]|uniref:Outer dynein arm-docking complex subunit 4 n=1 Tax=Hexamita inflata TaxID=28002 RepID=A0AA86QL17_9EUKA|nr:Dynein binding protein [Hexamita inflata]